jgi:acetyl/propionyl-CoA carboxylase alpha subunit
MITGLDLVEMQIRVAEGHTLTVSQSDIKINGHAIELRVYAENASNQFLPSTGKLVRYHPPKGIGIRVDDGYTEGDVIPIHYDPMISKLIAHAPSRSEAIQLMTKAIMDYKIHGVDTTLGFGKFAINHDAFSSGKFDTHFVEKYMPAYLEQLNLENELAAKFIASVYQKEKKKLVLPKMEN